MADQARATLKKNGYQEFLRMLITKKGNNVMVAKATIK